MIAFAGGIWQKNGRKSWMNWAKNRRIGKQRRRRCPGQGMNRC
ncbi:hypothetical protein BV133_2409 [Blastochloris viridis]|uniref:Uncharacterized protein n=1 Tax=Blastochloris viridis TaxID=1079 RepID=A0A182D5G2_BLAVI|nr:hypothetical protein BV133_2409 [Blastochloris viridis]